MVTDNDRIIEEHVTIQPGGYFSFNWSGNVYKAISKAGTGAVFARKVDCPHNYRPNALTSFSAEQMTKAIPVAYTPPSEEL